MRRQAGRKLRLKTTSWSASTLFRILTLDFRKTLAINLFRLFWLGLIIVTDMLIFRHAPASCPWPEFGLDSSSPFNVLIVSDPQILGPTSYPERLSLVNWFTIKLADNYAKKSFHGIMRQSKPDAIVFLGDMLDCGVDVIDEAEFTRYMRRFRRIFSYPLDMPTIYVPGNHDRGLSTSPGGVTLSKSQFLEQRFIETFGPLHGQVDWGNHTLIWFDAQKLLEETAADGSRAAVESSAAGTSVTSFIDRASYAPHDHPRILLTHIPLWRTPGSTCGPLREHSKAIHAGTGKNYQNMLGQKTTETVLNSIKPEIVFSGDDHDYCESLHTVPATNNRVREITVKAFSMTMGVHRPGYELMSLSTNNNINVQQIENENDDDDHNPTGTSFKVKPCELPDQVKIYTHVYIPCFLFTLVCIIFLESRRQNLERLMSGGNKSQSSSSPATPLHAKHDSSDAGYDDDDDEDDDDDIDEEKGSYNITNRSRSTPRPFLKQQQQQQSRRKKSSPTLNNSKYYNPKGVNKFSNLFKRVVLDIWAIVWFVNIFYYAILWISE